MRIDPGVVLFSTAAAVLGACGGAAPVAAVVAPPPVASAVSAPPPPAPPPPPASPPPATTEAAPAIDDVLREAAAAKTPVLLDFGAGWCAPCAALKTTFALPEVSRALGAYRLVKYEIDDDGAGAAAGARFDATSLPLLVVLSPDGAEIDRGSGGTAKELAGWLDARAPIAARGALTEERLAGEKDALALLLAARAAEHARASDRAERLFTRARAADAKDARGVGAEAAFALTRFRARREEARAHGKLLLEYAQAFPASAFARRALEGVTALPPEARPARADVARVDKIVRGALGAKHDDAELARLAPIEVALGLGAGAPPVKPPQDPLVEVAATASASEGGPPEIIAMMRRDFAVGDRIGRACKGTPHAEAIHEEYVRIWIEGGAVTRALFLDPDADAAVKACVEQAAKVERDLLPIYGAVHDWTVRFPVK